MTGAQKKEPTPVQNWMFESIAVLKLGVCVDVCGNCGVIEESSPLRGRFDSPLIRDFSGESNLPVKGKIPQ